MRKDNEAFKGPGTSPGESLASLIDHTLLHPAATEKQIHTLCQEAVQYGFKAVCINGCYLPLAKGLLHDTGVNLATVIGFPLGASSTLAKICQAKACLEAGAVELDVVLNIGWLQSGKQSELAAELGALREAAPEACLKLILETCYLEQDQKEIACQLALAAGWDFVKTSTGFGTSGASEQDVQLMRRAVGERMGVKASGGIRDLERAQAMVKAGATRIGTSSGLAIVEAEKNLKV
jgi:deoxyribose-phosphate aldolase